MTMGKTSRGYEWDGPDSDGEIEIEEDASGEYSVLWLTEKDLKEMLFAFKEMSP